MSHFSVLVIGNDVDAAMAPFDESITVAPYVLYTKEQLIEKSKKEIQEYKEGRYAEYLADPEKYLAECAGNPGHVNYIQVEFPKKLEWTDEEHYQHQLGFYDDEDIGMNGEVYARYNPQGHWDWYQVGGRWAGGITVKPGTTFETPNFSWGWSEEEKKQVMESLRTDSALLKDIDFEVMIADKIKDYKERYALLGKWDELDDAVKITTFWGAIDEKEFVQAGHTLEEYLEEFIPHPLTAYAYIHNGIWHARGKMFGFAVSEDTMTKAEWKEQFDKFIASLDPETRITFVDCHC